MLNYLIGCHKKYKNSLPYAIETCWLPFFCQASGDKISKITQMSRYQKKKKKNSDITRGGGSKGEVGSADPTNF